MNGEYGPSMGGYFKPVQMADRARKMRQELEGAWNWEPGMESSSDALKTVELRGAPDTYMGSDDPFVSGTIMGAVPVDGKEYYEPVPVRDVVGYGQMSWSPMIPESYPGLFYDPATGKMSSQKEIMARLKWPKMGDIPYQYNPPRPRGFMGIEYPLKGYGATRLPPGANPVQYLSDMLGISLSEAQFVLAYLQGLCPRMGYPQGLQVVPEAQRNPMVLKFVKSDSTISTDQKIMLFRAFPLIADLPPSNASLFTQEASKMEEEQKLFRNWSLVGVAIAGVAGAGFVIWKKSKKEP